MKHSRIASRILPSVILVSACGSLGIPEPVDADVVAAIRAKTNDLAILGGQILDCTRATQEERPVRVCDAYVEALRLKQSILGEALGSESGGVCWRVTLIRAVSLDQPDLAPESGGVWAPIGVQKYQGRLSQDTPESLKFPNSPELRVTTTATGFGFGPRGIAFVENGRRLSAADALSSIERASDREPTSPPLSAAEKARLRDQCKTDLAAS